jgi:hypothetical protein
MNSSHLLPDAGGVSTPDGQTHVSIRGVRLALDELMNPALKSREGLDALRDRMAASQPFPHLVVEEWFNPVLLQLVREEFDVLPNRDWKTEFNDQARVERSRVDAEMGPASQLYFSLLNSRAFINVLSQVTGIDGLIADPHLLGGGLHETLAGGHFGIHTDFDRHPCTGLHNELVFITYLNHDWRSDWNGALELWDGGKKRCEVKIEPEFGRSIVMTHGPRHFHGHSLPLAPPPKVTRRSVAAYFYSNRFKDDDQQGGMSSNYLFSSRATKAKKFVKQFIPPILLTAVKHLRGGDRE